jgi:predicted XRE-type DNA-binding protein
MKLMSVTALEPYTLELTYSDFMQFQVDISPLIARGKVFKVLENKDVFKQVQVSEAGDAVTWGEVEIQNPADPDQQKTHKDFVPQVDLDATNLRLEGEKHKIISKRNIISSQLREALELAGLTQTELAELIGSKQPNVARLLSDDYQGHSLTTLQKIAEVIGKRLVVELR